MMLLFLKPTVNLQSQEHLELLKNKLVDFIAFKLDC